MKLSLMRPALVLALALSLASCGGKAGFTIAGEVGGLKYSGLQLSTNGMTINVEPPAPTSTETVKFEFPNQIEYGEVYEVKIEKLPKVQDVEVQDCDLDASSTNTAGRLSTINVIVSCALKTNSVSGTVKGLTGTGLQLTNGSTGGVLGITPSATADPTFSFTNIAYGDAYGITVLTPPAGQVCTVGAGGIGTMKEAGIKNGIKDVVVQCTNVAQ